MTEPDDEDSVTTFDEGVRAFVEKRPPAFEGHLPLHLRRETMPRFDIGR